VFPAPRGPISNQREAKKQPQQIRKNFHGLARL
jgi:hypothetical protein